MSSITARWEGSGIIARRVRARLKSRSRRTGHALAHSGPGRLPGVVLDATLSGQHVTVHGWARAHPHEIVAVVVEVNGKARAVAAHGLDTPRALDGSPVTSRALAGWTAILTLPTVPEIPQVVEAIVVHRKGLADRLDAVVARPHDASDLPLGHVDSPADGAAVVAPLIHVRGWIRHHIGFTRVEAGFEGHRPSGARILSQPRPDLAGRLQEPSAELAGWEVWLPAPPVVRATEMRLHIDAFLGGERHAMASRTVVVTPAVRKQPDAQRIAQLSHRVHALADAAGGEAGATLLVTAHHLGLGGGQLYLQELLRHLMADGTLRCHVFAQTDGCLRDELEAWGAQVHIVGAIPVDGLGYEARMLELVALAAAGSPGVLLANTAGTYWGVDLATRLGIGSIWAIHESFSPEHFLAVGFPAPPDEHVAARFRHSFAAANAIVYEAGATKLLYSELTPPDRAIRLDYGIDLGRIDSFMAARDRGALRAGHRLIDDDVAIVCVGTLEPRKGPGVLCAAFARLALEFPAAQLFLVGDSASEFSGGLHRMVNGLGLGRRVHFVPVTSQIDEWYLTADIFALASDIESLPTSVLEAMAFRRPVVASRIFGLPELIRDGHDGFLFDPNDIDAAEEALRRVLRLTAEQRAEVGAAARALIETTRTSGPCARSYQRLIERLLADPKECPRPALLGLRGGATHD